MHNILKLFLIACETIFFTIALLNEGVLITKYLRFGR